MSNFKYYPEEAKQIAKYGTVSDAEYNKILCDIWKKCDVTQKGLFERLNAAVHGSGESIFSILDELSAECREECALENELNATTYDAIEGRGMMFPTETGNGVHCLPHTEVTVTEKHLERMR